MIIATNRPDVAIPTILFELLMNLIRNKRPQNLIRSQVALSITIPKQIKYFLAQKGKCFIECNPKEKNTRTKKIKIRQKRSKLQNKIKNGKITDSKDNAQGKHYE